MTHREWMNIPHRKWVVHDDTFVHDLSYASIQGDLANTYQTDSPFSSKQ